MRFIEDRVFRVPRKWSNQQLRRFGDRFRGDVVNVSGWKDADKEGGVYRSYFPNATSYAITNFTVHYDNRPDELFLDLEKPLPGELTDKFDVVFNHTVLEHIYECHAAFANLCRMTRDVVILVVPFLQPYHASYGDYWRFTPLTLERMFRDNGLTQVYCSFNEHWLCSIYLFAIGTKQPKRWEGQFPTHSREISARGAWAGSRSIPSLRMLRNKASGSELE